MFGACPPAATVTAPALAASLTFVQDQVGVSDLGPSVRVDFGDTVAKGQRIGRVERRNGLEMMLRALVHNLMLGRTKKQGRD